MKRAVVLAVALLALGASGARAHTTIACPEGCSYPYQQWVDEARVPTPTGAVSIVPAEPGGVCQQEYGYDPVACVDTASRTIYATQPLRRHGLEHELGHVEDAEAMTDEMRARFAALIRWPASPWLSATTHATAGEYFAEAYALCFGGLPRNAYLWFGGDTYVGQPRLRATCRMIDKL